VKQSVIIIIITKKEHILRFPRSLGRVSLFEEEEDEEEEEVRLALLGSASRAISSARSLERKKKTEKAREEERMRENAKQERPKKGKSLLFNF
jgi:hypothetical protein